MKRSAITLLHAAYWLAFFGLWIIVVTVINQFPTFSSEDVTFYAGVVIGIAIVPGIFSFYVFYLILFPRYLQKGKITQAVVSGLLVSLFSFLLAALTLRFTANMGWSCYGESDYVAILMVSFIALVNGVIAFIIRGFITWFQEIKLKEELQNKNHEMEMALVKSQLDPHFLFNTLNNIDILILKDPQQASEYLNKLSDIMRFMLFETKTKKIPLSQELEYIRKYVELQKIRTTNTDYVNYKVVGDPSGHTIAPLVFIPFIENAFKHTNNKKLKDAINIEIKVNGRSVKMNCENKIDLSQHSRAEQNGLGHELIEKRLKLLYGERHELKIRESADAFRVELNIDYDEI